MPSLSDAAETQYNLRVLRYLLDDGRPDFPNIIMISKLELTWLNSYQAMFIVVLLVTQTRPNKFTNPCEI